MVDRAVEEGERLMQRKHDVIERRINEIAAQHGGKITPAMVVEDARSEESPLHEFFEWDLDRAAYAHWLDTARGMLQKVRIVVIEERCTVRVPAYVEDPEKTAGAQGMVHVASVRERRDVARDVLWAEMRRAESLIRRCHGLAVYFGLDVHTEQILAEMSAMIVSLEEAKPE